MKKATLELLKEVIKNYTQRELQELAEEACRDAEAEIKERSKVFNIPVTKEVLDTWVD